MRGYELRGDLVLKQELARPFEGWLPMQVPVGCYVCRPVIGQLQKLLEARGPVPYYLLATVVAVGPHEGSIVPWYWPYPCQGDDKFWRDCEAAGIDPNLMDHGCSFTAGALQLVVRRVRKGKDWCREVSSVTNLASVIPEAIWPTEADKPSVKKARTHTTRSAVAAAASLHAGVTSHQQHANDDNEKVR